jgi:hypothetical protein
VRSKLTGPAWEGFCRSFFVERLLAAGALDVVRVLAGVVFGDVGADGKLDREERVEVLVDLGVGDLGADAVFYFAFGIEKGDGPGLDHGLGRLSPPVSSAYTQLARCSALSEFIDVDIPFIAYLRNIQSSIYFDPRSRRSV